MQKGDHLNGRPSVSKTLGWLFLALLGSMLFSCAHRSETPLPKIVVETKGVYHPGKFIWFELLTENADAVHLFYSELFGWTMAEDAEYPHYTTIIHNGTAIGGILAVTGEDASAIESRWICSVSVGDVDAAAVKVPQLGGKVLYGPVDSGERGRLAQVADSQGANLILLRTLQGDPQKPSTAPGNPVWADLFTRNYAASTSFYSALLGYKVVNSKEDTDHFYFAMGDKIRAGLVVVSWEDLESTWLPYIGVSDLREAVLKAMDLGGTLLAHTESAAVVLDPSGAAIGLQLLEQKGE